MRCMTLGKRGRLPNRRPDEWMAEAEVALGDVDEARVNRRNEVVERHLCVRDVRGGVEVLTQCEFVGQGCNQQQRPR